MQDNPLQYLQGRISDLAEEQGRRPKLLLVEFGGYNASALAIYAREAGMDVIYEHPDLSASQIAVSALQEGVHLICLAIAPGRSLAVDKIQRALQETRVSAPLFICGTEIDQKLSVAASSPLQEIIKSLQEYVGVLHKEKSYLR